MKRFTQWGLQLIPVVLGSAVLFYAMLSGSPWMTAAYMKVISMGSMVTNFIRTALSPLKFIAS